MFNLQVASFFSPLVGVFPLTKGESFFSYPLIGAIPAESKSGRLRKLFFLVQYTSFSPPSLSC